MSELAAQIGEALRPHFWWACGNSGVPGMADVLFYKCTCGWQGDDPHGHQGAAVTEALQLTPEFRAEGFMPNIEVVSRVAAEASDRKLMIRWITPWEEE